MKKNNGSLPANRGCTGPVYCVFGWNGIRLCWMFNTVYHTGFGRINIDGFFLER